MPNGWIGRCLKRCSHQCRCP